MLYIILFLHQTTTSWDFTIFAPRLYIILFLHQTTTFFVGIKILTSCISFFSYIKPQHLIGFSCTLFSCISFFSYIKPQHVCQSCFPVKVVYHSFPTSNHNLVSHTSCRYALYIILFLHQTTTKEEGGRCSLLLYIILFLHQTTTVMGSNHLHSLLYIILFLHQTTTTQPVSCQGHGCISFFSYIKPQLIKCQSYHRSRCISFFSYIKPQLAL